VVDLTGRRWLRKAGIRWGQLIDARHTIPQEIGLQAWETGIEALLVPSAADRNLAVFLDNQRPPWGVELASLTAIPG
jgi:exonuclease V gamma subunit